MRKLRSSFEYQHSDGTLLQIRCVRPEDKERITDGLGMMSDEALYLRFFMPIKKLSDQQLEYLTEVDHSDHIAWGILDRDHLEIPGLGIARFVRQTENPAIAEAAVTVPDRYQKRGYGTLLLAVLNHSARVKGIEILRSNVLYKNTNLIASLAKLGGIVQTPQDNVVTVDLPVITDMNSLEKKPIGALYKKYLLELDELMFE